MKDFLLTEETANTPIGQLLRDADEEISVRDGSGEIVARIVLEQPDGAVRLSDEELALVRRRRESGREGALTTPELNEYLRSLTADPQP